MKRLVVGVWTLLLALACVPALAGAGDPYLDLDRSTGGVSNQKAFRVGDIVTVLVVENAQASTTAKTDANTKSEISGGPGLGILNQITDWGLETENKFAGDGKSSRTGSLNTQMSTRVVEQLRNGNLRLAGERTVEINGEMQIIELTGIVRPQDVRADNTVESTLIADAVISYSGDGPVADAHSPGLLTRIANFLF
ncbi:MAG TPA: flagellar basal body L-ring protein FlgH [Candidatus Krumholzibacteria bacterium]|nr:flagellar basal body L-ring protein FlgH [Candidatus Krumholzibacteria bacterium]